MRKNVKIAFSGIMCALSVVLLALASVLWILDYTSPLLCGLLLIVTNESFGKKSSLCVYLATSILALFLLPSKGAAVLYTMFCGYYPIIRIYIERLNSRLLRIILKFIIFNIGAVGSELIMVYVFRVPFDNMFGVWGIVILLLAGYVILFTYDRLIHVLTLIYVKKYKKRVEKFLK